MRARPDLHQLKRQAKELLEAFRASEFDAVAEVYRHSRDADPTTFALHDAQLVIARAYGFESWPKLNAYMDGVTVAGLADAVCGGDTAKVRAMLAARPRFKPFHVRRTFIGVGCLQPVECVLDIAQRWDDGVGGHAEIITRLAPVAEQAGSRPELASDPVIRVA